jgi:hypothetical protein
MRDFLQRHGALLGSSHRFCRHGEYWADIVQPGWATTATGRTRLSAARTAVAQFRAFHNC